MVDYRLYNPDDDGNSKLEHVHSLLTGAVFAKQLLFKIVLMDSWYAAKKLMAAIEELGKVYYCPLKRNRLVDDSGGDEPYKRIDQLSWTAAESRHGKVIKVRGFPRIQEGEIVPRHCLYRLFWEYVVTNDLTQALTDDTQKVCAVRWKIEVRAIPPSHGGMLGSHLEQFHREIKQTTGIESCQCRKQRIQPQSFGGKLPPKILRCNHIACAMLVWTRLKQITYVNVSSG